jgi:thioredoxin 1
MSDTDDIERIRAEKRERLERELSGDAGDAGDAAGSPDDPVHVDGSAHLADLTADHDVVLVDFYADWCGPCQMIEPVVESVAASTPAAVAKVDIDANQALASQHGVRGVPTLLLVVDGETVERMVGVQSEDELTALIDRYA